MQTKISAQVNIVNQQHINVRRTTTGNHCEVKGCRMDIVAYNASLFGLRGYFYEIVVTLKTASATGSGDMFRELQNLKQSEMIAQYKSGLPELKV
eukprot:m.37889 g.37889  ORF g.37889 m.37889 type:complete len:95 (-) comp17777_c0_seq1:354-638(-)